VASIAFHEPVAALDGNVKRVVSRILGEPEETSRQKKRLEDSVGQLIPSGRASDFNQALMDLGALICVPTQPRCLQCPVKRFCGWQGVEKGKKKGPPRRVKKQVWAVALVEQDGRYLIHRKEGKGLLAGLWQFPIVVLEEKVSGVVGQERKIIRGALRDRFGLRIKIKGQLPTQEHQFTHMDVTMKPFRCSLLETVSADKVPGDLRWMKPSNLSRYPISRAMGKIAALIL
jgi:A/G-specific adenine glycosylase